MDCPKCGTTYLVVTDEDARSRSICECEITQKCLKCKKGFHEPVNQAVIDVDNDVVRYSCARHGVIGGEEFEIPAAPIGSKQKLKPPTPIPVVAPSTSSESSMEILEKGWTAAKWKQVKESVLEDLKDPKQQYKVVCSSCQKEHVHGKRKIKADENKFLMQLVCPFCSAPGYRIL